MSFFNNFHNFCKEFGSYFLFLLVIFLVTYCFIYVLKSLQKKADKERKEREDEERQKLVLSNLSQLSGALDSITNFTENIYQCTNILGYYNQVFAKIIAGLEEVCLHNILKNNSQIEILANGKLDKNNLLFTCNKPLEFSLPDDELSFIQNFDKLAPENTKKINIKFNAVEFNAVEEKSNIPVEFEVFIREGN